jgi:hypothetical protein
VGASPVVHGGVSDCIWFLLFVLRIKAGKEPAVSRTYQQNLKSITKFWVGADAFLPE